MFETARVNLTAQRRAAFVDLIGVFGVDLIGATFQMQVRDRAGGGLLRASLSSTGGAEQFVRVESVSLVNGVPLSTIRIQISAATMATMDIAADRGEPDQPARAFYDIHFAVPGQLTFVGVAGDFIVHPGVVE